MGCGPSKGDKKITSALTNEGTDWPHGKRAGQDCKAGEWMAGNDPFRGRKVWSQTSRRLPITVQTTPKLEPANSRPTAHPGARLGVLLAWWRRCYSPRPTSDRALRSHGV